MTTIIPVVYSDPDILGGMPVFFGTEIRVIPDLRSDPRNLSTTEVVYGLAAMFVGVVLLAVVVVRFFISERPDTREAQSTNTNE